MSVETHETAGVLFITWPNGRLEGFETPEAREAALAEFAEDQAAFYAA